MWRDVPSPPRRVTVIWFTALAGVVKVPGALASKVWRRHTLAVLEERARDRAGSGIEAGRDGTLGRLAVGTGDRGRAIRAGRALSSRRAGESKRGNEREQGEHDVRSTGRRSGTTRDRTQHINKPNGQSRCSTRRECDRAQQAPSRQSERSIAMRRPTAPSDGTLRLSSARDMGCDRLQTRASRSPESRRRRVRGRSPSNGVEPSRSPSAQRNGRRRRRQLRSSLISSSGCQHAAHQRKALNCGMKRVRSRRSVDEASDEAGRRLGQQTEIPRPFCRGGAITCGSGRRAG